MSIASEITRLQGVKSDILQAIADKGVTVPAGSALDDCPGLIADISGGGEFTLDNIVPIIAVNRIYVVDDNGYIGYDVTKYFQYDFSNTYRNFAFLASGNDFSQMGLGSVTFAPNGTDYIGGVQYPTVTIGTQTWLAKNLDFKYSGLIVDDSGSSESDPMAHYYNKDEATYGATYGLLYNWPACKYLDTNKATLCPGWHVPTEAEWSTLINAVGGQSIAGLKLKSATDWNGDGTYSFNALASGGGASSDSGLGTWTNFWTSDQTNGNGIFKGFSTSSDAASASNAGRNQCYSLRLVRDVV